jgi:deoxyribose-phosphate aldolase
MNNLGSVIDHTLLKPEASCEQIKQICSEAISHSFASVCTNSSHTKLVASLLKGSNVKVCAVVGFPLGAMHTLAKVAETAQACADGADEIDMVLNIGALKEANNELVYNDIKLVVDEAARHKAIVKVILETCLLSDAEKIEACKLSVRAGAAFVKTSTGFSSGGATIADVTLMAQSVAGKAKVKASGGIRNLADTEAMLKAGANRIGTSNGVAIIQGEQAKGGY